MQRIDVRSWTMEVLSEDEDDIKMRRKLWSPYDNWQNFYEI